MVKFSPIQDDVPKPPVGTRGSGFIADTGKRKSEVVARAHAAWQAKEYGEPERRGVLRRVADAFLDEYLGRAPDADEVKAKTKTLMQAIRSYSS